MRKKIAASVAAVALAAGAAVVLSGSASADDGWLCTTRDATPVYATMNNGQFSDYLFTLSPGRGFRAYHVEAYVVEDTVVWSAHYGHGAERPDRNAYVRSEHLAC
ncbi:MAG: hypothetical protein ACRDSK_22080 [Actinophytocola sp.]|uniref:hypothetical protein n=1 Tax=Actinophytocola sp. TaxID=1872138 RepID=UPI003D6AD535